MCRASCRGPCRGMFTPDVYADVYADVLGVMIRVSGLKYPSYMHMHRGLRAASCPSPWG